IPTAAPTKMPTTIRPRRKVTIARPFIDCHLLSREVDGVILGHAREANVNPRWRSRVTRAPVVEGVRTPGSAGRGFDHHARQAVLLRQAIRLGGGVAGPGERPVCLEEVRVLGAMAGGVGIR